MTSGPGPGGTGGVSPPGCVPTGSEPWDATRSRGGQGRDVGAHPVDAE